MKKAFTLITLLFFSNFLFSQELHQAESFQLGSPIIGNQIYEASQYIQIQSGFGYSTQSNASFIAKTNPLLVVPPIEGKTGGPSGSDPALAGVFGAIVMDANVGENGNAIVTIPITVCPGISGIIPQLSIVYNSTGAESFIGKGWGLGGLSAITKVTKTKYYDNVAEAVLNTPEYETFALDGERLIWDETKQYYRTEFEKFAKITKVYDGNQIKFKVWTKDGSIIEYGYTNDSRQTILNLVGNSTTNAIAWHVNKISDIYGNSIDIKYLKDGGMCYPLEVQYSVTSINPDGNKIKFYYENQASISKYWFQGVNQEANYCETKKLLDSIEVYSNNSLFRKYGLKYITHGQLQKKFLESVTESNGDNEKLYPVKLNWQLDEDGYECDVANVDGFEMHDDNVLTDENFKTLIIPSNINDDILTDFYTLTSSALLGHERLYKYINTGSGYIGSDITPLGLFLYPYFYESQVYTVGDFNSDSKDDLVFVTGIAIPVYSGGFLTPEPTQVIERPQGSITQALTGDFNADGITDLMLVVQRRFIGIPPKCLIYFGSTNGLPTEPNKTVEFADTPIDASDVIVMVGDFNGDGVGDIYGTYYVSSGTFAVQRIFQYSNDNFAEIPVFPPLVFAREGKSEVQLGDFNGDMKSDILWIFDESQFNSNQNILLMLSYGNGFFNNSITNETYSDLLNAKSSAYIVSDFNNDGKTDFFQYDRTMPFINRMFTINRNGTSFEQTEISFPVFPSYPPSNQTRSNFIAGDFDGDGKIDLLNMFEESMQGFWPWQEDYKCSLNIGVSTKNKNNLLTKVTNSLCGETIFSYQYMTNPEVYQQARYDRELTPYPFNIFKGNLPLVLEKKISNGLGGYLVTKYKYLAGLTNVTGKGFAGFRVREAYDESSFITTSYYNEIFPDLGILVPRTINKSVLPPGATSATSISSTTISTSDLELGTGFQSHFLYSISTTTTDDINQIWKTEKMLDPDIYGNFTRIETHSGKISGRFRPEEHKTILTNTFDNITDGGKWILGRLVSSVATQTAANKTPITRNSSFTYYTNGRLESETVEPGNAKRTTKYYFYDNIGNITHSKITAPGLPDRHSYTEYDNENRFIDKIINNVGLTSEQLNFEPHGHPTLVKDANQNEFNYIYDKFGRLTKEILPTGIQSSKVYRWITTNDNDAPENAIYDTWEQTTGGTPTVVYYDNLARALRIVRIGFNGNKIFVDTKYDVRGRMERVSDPYSSGESILWTINTYDDYDRIIKTTRPGDIFDTYTFTPCKVVHANPLSQTTTSEVNSMGWVLSSTDADGINVKNEYNSGGFLTRTFIADASGNEIAATDISKDYDIFGNCITLNDRNLGDRAYVYNAFGELISSQKLLNSELTIYSYDGIGRMINRTEPGSIITTWQYDTKTKGKGMVDKITYPDNIEEYFYDNYSRPIQKNISIESVTYSYYNDYDPFGRALSITYPTGLIVKNGYYSGRNLG
jgi:YD repeat-containing protein